MTLLLKRRDHNQNFKTSDNSTFSLISKFPHNSSLAPKERIKKKRNKDQEDSVEEVLPMSVNQRQELLPRLRIISEHSKHCTGDGLTIQFLHTSHYHTHVTVKEKG